MNRAYWKCVGILAALSLFVIQGFAQSCETFAGNYITVSDTAKPVVKLLQDGCQSITLVDNAGISWPIYLDGRTTRLPDSILQKFGAGLTDAYYSATLAGPNQIHLKVHTRVSLVAPGSNFHIGTEADYQADAYLLGGQKRKIQLETRSVKLLSVDAKDVIGGQSAGFLQGANWILDMAKHMLDTTLQ